MKNAFASYRKRKQAKINAKMANMRSAKERKRIALHAGEPVRCDVDDSIEITVTRRMGGRIIHEGSLLLINEPGRGTVNQYDVWEPQTRRYVGLMGIYKAFLEAAKGCPSIRIPT